VAVFKTESVMKLTLAIRNRLKQRKHMELLVKELERDIEEALRIKTRYEQTIKTLNFELNAWDKFSSENKT
jgi:hypothetical protein